MKQFAKNILAVLTTLLLIALFALAFSSCSSLKKDKQKETTDSSKVVKVDSSTTAEVKKEVTEKVTEEKKEEFTQEVTEVILEPGDSIEVSVYDKSGNKTGSKKHVGSGTIKYFKTKSKTDKKKTSYVVKTSDSIGKTNLSKTDKYKSSSSKVALNKSKKGFSFMDQLLWLALLILLIGLELRYKAISRLFAFFTKKSNQ